MKRTITLQGEVFDLAAQPETGGSRFVMQTFEHYPDGKSFAAAPSVIPAPLGDLRKGINAHRKLFPQSKARIYRSTEAPAAYVMEVTDEQKVTTRGLLFPYSELNWQVVKYCWEHNN